LENKNKIRKHPKIQTKTEIKRKNHWNEKKNYLKYFLKGNQFADGSFLTIIGRLPEAI
jgi:hypothetical protein